MVLAATLHGFGGLFVVVGATSKAAMTMISAAKTGIHGVAKYQLAFHAQVTIAIVMILCPGPLRVGNEYCNNCGKYWVYSYHQGLDVYLSVCNCSCSGYYCCGNVPCALGSGTLNFSSKYYTFCSDYESFVREH